MDVSVKQGIRRQERLKKLEVMLDQTCSMEGESDMTSFYWLYRHDDGRSWRLRPSFVGNRVEEIVRLRNRKSMIPSYRQIEIDASMFDYLF